MIKTAVIFSPIYFQHDTGRNHPETAQRLRTIVNELKKRTSSSTKNWQFVAPEKALVEDAELVHDRGYIEHVDAFCRAGGGLLDEVQTTVSADSFEVALHAVGGTLKAVNLVMEKKVENAFAAVRPPGHHAERFHACGFCIFNNVAIAAEYLIRKFNLERIVILDIDAHHGNGTQEAFYETDKVLYISLHEDPTEFPQTGFEDEIGKGNGLGYNVNIPLPFGTDDRIYLRAMKEIVTPTIRQYKPQFILVSAGLDGHYTDPVANLSLSGLCYKEIWKTIVDLASKTCNGKLVAALEGGYSLKFVGKLATAAIARMSETPYALHDRISKSKKQVKIQGDKIIKEVRKIQRDFWDID